MNEHQTSVASSLCYGGKNLLLVARIALCDNAAIGMLMRVDSLRLFVLTGVLVFGSTCGGEKEDGGGMRIKPLSDFEDNDLDSYTEAEGDCDDKNRFIHPGALDPCDGIDQNCTDGPDEAFDQDRDGFTSCNGDCRDFDAKSYPRQNEFVDGIDNDCDGIIDNHTTQYDDDGDGFSEDQGDCNDFPHLNGQLFGPNSIEVAIDPATGLAEGKDNDCDGEIDEAILPCDMTKARTDAEKLAYSIGICNELLRASFPADKDIDKRSRGVFDKYGNTYKPREGSEFAVLASGIAGDRDRPGFVEVQSGTMFENEVSHPDPQGPIGCSSADEPSVNDYTELELVLKVPGNAKSLTFDFNFMSAEFPEYVCSSFDDTFLALLDSEKFKGNVSFDSMGNRMSINVGFFDVCNPMHGPACSSDADLIGTGYEGSIGGGTGWLTTTAPVQPGEKATLRFIIFDEGDHVLDSAVIIDHFRWGIEEIDDPITVE